MKKILVAIALVVVMATLLMLPVAGADNSKVSIEELIKWNAHDSALHYVGQPTTTPPVQDGNIRKGEYTYSFRMTDPIFPCDSNYNKIAYNPEVDYSSNYIEYYASYDEDYVYIGVYDDEHKNAGSSINFFMKFGIDPENVENLVGTGTQLMKRGTSVKNEFYKGSTEGVDKNYVSVNGKQVRYIDTAICAPADDGYGAYDTVYEFKFNRDDLTEIFNGNQGTGFVENPNVFLITTWMHQYGDKKGDVYTFYRWCGKALSNVERMNLGTSLEYIPAIFVLGEKGDDFLGNAALEVPAKPVETEAPVTEAPTTEPETEAPTTELVTEAPATEAPVTEAPTTEAPETEAPKAESGCGSSVAVMGIALVATLGTCVAVVSKKKED